MIEEQRPDPDELLKKYHHEHKAERGALKVFFGYAAGVGKTFSMLREALEEQAQGKNILVGYVEPHARPATLALLDDLVLLPVKQMVYREMTLPEFDLDLALKLKPEIVLVDELAHTNVSGSRNRKRYQDIQELLQAGIDVYTTVNVQHLESLNDIVSDITGIQVHETVPDSFFDEALIKLVDIEPADLLERLASGKIYKPENASRAMANFFTVEKLSLLREIAIRKAADHISLDNRYETSAGKRRVQGKLLVYLDGKSSFGSEKAIRWTARLAAAFHEEWLALIIEPESDEESNQSSSRTDLIKLVETLDGEIVTLKSDDKLETLSHYAKITGISDIIISKNSRKTLRAKLFRQETEDYLIQDLHDVDIHIVPYATEEIPQLLGQRVIRFLKGQEISRRDFFKTLALLIVGTLGSSLLTSLGFGDQNVLIVYLFMVIIIARVTTGYVYSVLASLSSVVLINWFFVEPLYSFTMAKDGYPLTLILILSVALITSNMMIRVKNQAKESIEKEHRMEVIYQLTQSLLQSESLADIMQLTNQYLARTLERSVIFYADKPERNQDAYEIEIYQDRLEDGEALQEKDEQAVANWVFHNRKEAGFSSDTLMGAKGYYFPVVAHGEVLAVLGILAKPTAISYEQNNFLKLISSQITLAIERQNLFEEQQTIMLENEKEKMRGNLLRAISHDLRTPLTGILGASSVLLDSSAEMSPTDKRQLILDIKEDSEWLIRMVENILAVTRIDEGTMRVKKVPEAVDEIVGAAVGRIRKRFADQEIHVSVPADLILLPMDGKLVEQVLINLLENALNHGHSPKGIQLVVQANQQEVEFTVRDFGKGITPEKLTHLFEPQGESETELVPFDSQRGVGIGLSICKTIINAHDGQIYGSNHQDGGAEFKFTLPLAMKEG